MTIRNCEGKQMEQNKTNGLDELKQKMNLTELHISRMPRESNNWFKEFSNRKFEGDYGNCLMHIIDTYRGMTPVGYEELQSEIDTLQEQVDELRSELELLKGISLNNPKDNITTTKKMVDGTERRVN